MRKIIRKRFLEFSVAFCLLFIIYSCFAQEQISITTYYPAPIGIYGELRSARMAIGDAFLDPAVLCWPGSAAPCTYEANVSADLVVQGFVGIAAYNPTEPLVVGGNATVAGNFSVGGNALVASNVSVGEDLSVHYNTTIGGNLVVGTNLTVSGNSTLAQNLVVVGNSTLSQNLNVVQNSTLSSGNFTFIGRLMTMDAKAAKTYDPMQFKVPYWPTNRVFEKNDEGCNPQNPDTCGAMVYCEIIPGYTGS